MALFGKSTPKQIARVKVLGVRTAEETKVLGTYNSTVYCLVVVYADGERTLVECDSKTMLNEYVRYVDVN